MEYESDIRTLQIDLKQSKDDCTILRSENKRLKEEAQSMESDISKRYDALYVINLLFLFYLEK